VADEHEIGLECPDCGCRDFRTVRTTRKADHVQRVRQCRHCGRRVVTWERIAGAPRRRKQSGEPGVYRHVWEAAEEANDE
jgi:transcriptional regulator NrdR family protein